MVNCKRRPNHKRCQKKSVPVIPKSPTITASKLHESNINDIFGDLGIFNINSIKPTTISNEDYEYYDIEDYNTDNSNNNIVRSNKKKDTNKNDNSDVLNLMPEDAMLNPTARPTATTLPTTTVYNNLNIKNNKILQNDILNRNGSRMNLGPISFELNGWIVLVACFGFSIILVTLVWSVAKRVCDVYETRALRPPPTIARVTGENEDHDNNNRRRRKRARRNGQTNELHRNMVMNVPVESLARMVRLQQQQLPGIETNRNMPQLIELNVVDRVRDNHQNTNNQNNNSNHTSNSRDNSSNIRSSPDRTITQAPILTQPNIQTTNLQNSAPTYQTTGYDNHAFAPNCPQPIAPNFNTQPLYPQNPQLLPPQMVQAPYMQQSSAPPHLLNVNPMTGNFEVPNQINMTGGMPAQQIIAASNMQASVVPPQTLNNHEIVNDTQTINSNDLPNYSESQNLARIQENNNNIDSHSSRQQG